MKEGKEGREIVYLKKRRLVNVLLDLILFLFLKTNFRPRRSRRQRRRHRRRRRRDIANEFSI